MVTNSLESFPATGVDIHVSVDEAEAHGISPGDPAIIEATVRPYTVEEWLAEGGSRTFASVEDEVEFFARTPVPGAAPDPQRAPAPAPAAAATRPVAAVGARAEPERAEAALATEPAGAAVPAPAGEPARIVWKSGMARRAADAAPEPSA